MLILLAKGTTGRIAARPAWMQLGTVRPLADPISSPTKMIERGIMREEVSREGRAENNYAEGAWPMANRLLEYLHNRPSLLAS